MVAWGKDTVTGPASFLGEPKTMVPYRERIGQVVDLR